MEPNLETERGLFRIFSVQETVELLKLPILASCQVTVESFFQNSQEFSPFFPESLWIQLRGRYLLECTAYDQQLISAIQIDRKVKFSKIWNSCEPNYSKSPQYRKPIGIAFDVLITTINTNTSDTAIRKKMKLLCNNLTILLKFFDQLQKQLIIEEIVDLKLQFQPRQRLGANHGSDIHYRTKNILNQQQNLVQCYSKTIFENQQNINQFINKIFQISAFKLTVANLRIDRILESSNSIYLVSKSNYFTLANFIESKEINLKDIQRIAKVLFGTLNVLHQNGISVNNIHPHLIILEQRTQGYYPYLFKLQQHIKFNISNAQKGNEQKLMLTFNQEKLMDVRMVGFTMITRKLVKLDSTREFTPQLMNRMFEDIQNPQISGIPESIREILYRSCSQNYQKLLSASQILQLSFFRQDN